MARPPKPNVRYYLPKERVDKNGQTKLRGVASYARKRLSFSVVLEEWQLLQVFSAINSDGTLREDTKELYSHQDYSDPNSLYFELDELSAYLVFTRDIVLELINRAIKQGVWESMTSADLNMFLNLIAYWPLSEKRNEEERKSLFKKGGIFDTWVKKQDEQGADRSKRNLPAKR